MDNYSKLVEKLSEAIKFARDVETLRGITINNDSKAAFFSVLYDSVTGAIDSFMEVEELLRAEIEKELPDCFTDKSTNTKSDA